MKNCFVARCTKPFGHERHTNQGPCEQEATEKQVLGICETELLIEKFVKRLAHVFVARGILKGDADKAAKDLIANSLYRGDLGGYVRMLTKLLREMEGK